MYGKLSLYSTYLYKQGVKQHTKQLQNELRERLDILYKDNNNIEVHTFSSFLFRLAKRYNLVFDYRKFHYFSDE